MQIVAARTAALEYQDDEAPGLTGLVVDTVRDYFAPVVTWPYLALSRRFHAVTYFGCVVGFFLAAFGLGAMRPVLRDMPAANALQWSVMFGVAFLCIGIDRL